MNVKPIIFAAPMVRALIEGRKTQTRRLVKPQPTVFEVAGGGECRLALMADEPTDPNSRLRIWKGGHDGRAGVLTMQTVPFAPGDLLYVRETWFEGWISRDGVVVDETDFHYRASEPDIEGVDDGDGYSKLNADGSPRSPWRSPLHMPRRASRLTLEVTGVKVERLQEIEGQHPSDSDAIAEGVRAIHHGDGAYYYSAFNTEPDPNNWCDPADAFRELWDSINGKRPDACWAASPWVVAVTFIVHQVNVDALLSERGQAES